MTPCIYCDKENVMENSLLTVKEIAQYLNVSLRQVYRLIKSGMPYRKVGKHYRFCKQDIDNWTEVMK
jgi:putative molybdopterin biosynthesis protein